MKNLAITIVFFLSIINAISQEVLVRNTEGKDVDISKIIAQSEKDQPTVLIVWSRITCYGPCPKVIQAFVDRYPELQKKYNLRVILLNVDGMDDEVRKSTITKGKNDYPNVQIQSVSDFVRAYCKEKKWTFESYTDEYGNFWKAANLEGTPNTYLYINGEAELMLSGWVGNDYLEKLGFDTSVLSSPYDFPAYLIQKILEQMNGYEAYFTKEWKHTLKEFKPFYKRTVVKLGDLYEITDSWITGEIQMKATFKDISGNFYHGNAVYFYQNGNILETVIYEDNKRHGEYKRYYPSGTIKTTGNYWEGEKDSVWYYYDEAGKETKSELWERGLMVKTD